MKLKDNEDHEFQLNQESERRYVGKNMNKLTGTRLGKKLRHL